MAKSEAQKKANAKWEAKAKDQIRLVLNKGQREIIKQFAEAHGYSMNKFIIEAIKEKMERMTK